ncbi:hypothetical protein ABPG72_002159 [Tetrahymena utriculariae]
MIIQFSSQCQSIGCQKCTQNTILKTEICSQCTDQFILNQQGICVYQQCQPWEFLQLYQDSSNKTQYRCVSLCEETQMANQISRVCETTYQCASSFIYPSNTNKGQDISYVYYGAQDKLIYLVYKSFLNMIDQDSGSFVTSFSFPNGVQSISLTRNRLFLLNTNTKQILEWIPSSMTANILTTVTQGYAKVTSRIYILDSTNQIIYTSFNDNNTLIYFNSIKQGQSSLFDQINLNSPQQTISFFEDFIITQNAITFQVQIIYATYAQQNQQLYLFGNTQKYYCNQIKGQVLDGKYFIFKDGQQFILIFENSLNVYSYEIKNQYVECNLFQQQQQPLKLNLIDENICIGFKYNQKILLVSYSQSIVVYNSYNYQLIYLASLVYDKNIVSFNFLFKINEIYIYALLSNNIINIRKLNFDCKNNQDIIITTIYLNQVPSLINNPQILIQLSYTLQGNQLINSMVLASQEVQIIDDYLNKTVSIVKDFQNKIFQNNGQISKIVYIEKYYFLISCSLDGLIMVWKTIDPLSPIFQYQIEQQGNQCLDILSYEQTQLIALYTNQIIIFNLFNQIDISFYQFDSTQFSQILVNSNYACLVMNKSAIIKNQSRQNIAQSQQNSNPSQFTSLVTSFLSESNELITINMSYLIQVYTIDFINGVINSNPRKTFQSLKKITCYSFFNLSKGGFHIIFFDENLELTIIDQNFQTLIARSITIGIVYSIKSFEEGKYLLGIQLYQFIGYNQYSSIYLDLINQTQNQMGSTPGVVNYIQLKKTTNHLGQNIIKMIPMLTTSYNSLSYEIYIDINKDTINSPFGFFSFIPVEIITQSISNQEQSLIFSGSKSGQLRVIPTNHIQVFQIVFNSTSANSQDQVVKVFQSFQLGQYFVFTSVINCFSLHTDQLLETINFSSNQESIYNFFISNPLQILVSYISTEVILRDFKSNNKKFSLNLSSQESLLKKINGFFLDENTQELFLYGDGLIKISLDFSLQILISPVKAHLDNYKQCLFPTEIIVCIINNQNMVFFDRAENFLLFQTFILQDQLSGASIVADIVNKQVFVYKIYFEVYSFTGSYLKGISDVQYPIISISIQDQHIIVYTSAQIYIYLKGTLTYQTFISPSGGNFLGYLYIRSQKLIAYYLSLNQYGQVLFYSLANYQQAGFITNTYVQNKIGKVIKIMYDDDSQMFNYIDQYGNYQNVLNNAQKTTDQTFIIEEIQQNILNSPIDYQLDFKSNTAFVYNGQRVWRHNYNLFTRPHQRVISRPAIYYFQINNQGFLQFIISDYQNNIFIYNNYFLTFLNQFTQNILDMRVVQIDTQIRYIFFFSSQILLYNNQNTNFAQQTPDYVLSDYKFKRVIFQSKSRIIINTADNFIVDYDFFNYQQNNKLQLDTLEDVISILEIGSSLSNQWLFIYGTDQGRVLVYDLNSFKSTFVNFKQTISQPIQSIQIYSQHDFICLDNFGYVYMINSQTYSEYSIQPIQQSISQNIQQLFGSQIPMPIQILQFDMKYQRYFVNLKSYRFISIFSLEDYTLINYISFPDNEWKNMLFNDQYLILSSSYQINVHQFSNLSFVGYIRRYNRKDRITDIKLVEINKIIVVFVNRIESLLISPNAVTLVDSLSMIDPQLIYFAFNSDQMVLNYIGVAQNAIYEKRINYGLYENSYSIAYANQTKNCYFQLKYQNYIQASTSFQQVYGSSSLSLMYLLSIYLKDNIDNMNFLNQSSISVVFRPQNKDQNNLQIQKSSFESLNFDIQMDNFNLIFGQQQQEAISTNSNSQNINLQNITYNNQNITQSSQIQFYQKKQITFNQIFMRNISMDKQLQMFQNNKSYLFNFTQCQNVIISNFIIENLSLSDESSALIYSYQTSSFIIQNLTIQNSKFSSLIEIFQSSNIIFRNILIVNCSNDQVDTKGYAFQLIGILSQQIINFQAYNNRNIQLLLTNKQYLLQDQTTVVYSKDILVIEGAYAANNTFPQNTDQLNMQNILLMIQSSTVNFTNIQFKNNTGNIQFISNQNILIDNSCFQYNYGVLGGCLSSFQVNQSFKIKNTIFQKNQVSGSGGSIYLDNVNYFSIDSQSIVKYSSASIGGAIRIINKDVNLWKQYQINCLMLYNLAEIYGNDIGTFPMIFLVQVKNQKQNKYTQIYEGQLDTLSPSTTLYFQQLQSGGLFPFRVQLQDQYKRPFSVNQTKFKNNLYEQSILQELNSYFIQVAINQNSISKDKQNSFIELKGEGLIGIKQYDEDSKMFNFESMTLTSLPLVNISSVVIQFSFGNIGYIKQVQTNISFRSCQVGEILVQSFIQTSTQSSNQNQLSLISCTECTSGTYSLTDSAKDYKQYLTKNNFEKLNTEVCKQCPPEISFCQGNTLILLDGYWRFNNQTDKILKCNYVNPNICSEQNNTTNGCIQGYIGPLCEKCDTTGAVWKQRYAQPFQQYECDECSNYLVQHIGIIISIFFIMIYLYYSSFFFMKRYIYESRCNYLRLMKFLPFSRSCIQDESSYYIKLLINFLQISSLLFTFYVKFLPSFLNIMPQLAGTPSSKLIISTQCLFSAEAFENYGEEKIMIILQSLFPFLTLAFFCIILAILRKLKLKGVSLYHKYTMFNVVFLFFQSDCVQFFTKALSCRKIGENSFQMINILIDCKDQSYILFSYSYVIPNLLFWILLPTVQILRLRLKKGKKNQNLDNCLIKYKYGYFYSEYKTNFYYWEIIRMYLKIIIVIITSLLNQYEDQVSIICIMVIFAYVLLVINKQPFKSYSLYKQEIISYLLLIPCIFFQQLFRTYSQEIFQTLLAFIKFTYVGFMVVQIFKFKIDNENDILFKLMRFIFLKICCRQISSQFKFQKKNSRVLILWRKAYVNLIQIRIHHINENYIKLKTNLCKSITPQSRNFQIENLTKINDQIQDITQNTRNSPQFNRKRNESMKEYRFNFTNQISKIPLRQKSLSQFDNQLEFNRFMSNKEKDQNESQLHISEYSLKNKDQIKECSDQFEISDSTSKCFVVLNSNKEINPINTTKEIKVCQFKDINSKVSNINKQTSIEDN